MYKGRQASRLKQESIMKVNFLQWNCQSVWKKRPELEMKSNDYDVIILSETWLEPKDRWLLRQFDTVRLNRNNRRGGGVAILVRNGIKYQHLDITYNASNKLEVCGVKVFFDSKYYAIISLYKPPKRLSPLRNGGCSSFNSDVRS